MQERNKVEMKDVRVKRAYFRGKHVIRCCEIYSYYRSNQKCINESHIQTFPVCSPCLIKCLIVLLICYFHVCINKCKIYPSKSICILKLKWFTGSVKKYSCPLMFHHFIGFKKIHNSRVRIVNYGQCNLAFLTKK